MPARGQAWVFVDLQSWECIVKEAHTWVVGCLMTGLGAARLLDECVGCCQAV